MLARAGGGLASTVSSWVWRLVADDLRQAGASQIPSSVTPLSASFCRPLRALMASALTSS